MLFSFDIKSFLTILSYIVRYIFIGGDQVSTGIKGIADACREDYLLVKHGDNQI